MEWRNNMSYYEENKCGWKLKSNDNIGLDCCYLVICIDSKWNFNTCCFTFDCAGFFFGLPSIFDLLHMILLFFDVRWFLTWMVCSIEIFDLSRIFGETMIPRFFFQLVFFLNRISTKKKQFNIENVTNPLHYCFSSSQYISVIFCLFYSLLLLRW